MTKRPQNPAHGPHPKIVGNPQAPSINVTLAQMSRDAKRPLEEVREIWSERSAMREHLAGIPKFRAELRALVDTANVLGLPEV